LKSSKFKVRFDKPELGWFWQTLPKLADDFWHYKNHIPEIEDWINVNIQDTKKYGDATLTKILELSSKMIKHDPLKRAKVGDITLELATIRNPFPFCKACEEKYKVDTSRHPRHPGIFRHRKRVGERPHFSVGGILDKFSTNSPAPRHTTP
jgi:hypothetical protein